MSAAEERRAARVEGLQARLALEHEALWVLGVVGGREDDLLDLVLDTYRARRRSRDRLQSVLDRLGADPATPRPAYGTPPSGRDDARAAVADVELRLVAACVAMLPDEDEAGRRSAMANARASALSAVDWGADAEAFPGLA